MDDDQAQHIPVMLAEVLSALDLRLEALVVDGTLGLGGHARVMMETIGPEGLLIGMDWDASMLAIAKDRLAEYGQLRTVHADYRFLPHALAETASKEGRAPQADAILLDLGLNNAQIQDPERGITFLADGPLDMRMDRSKGEPASALLNRLSMAEIERILRDFGDENWGKRIAEVIVDRRKQRPLKTTQDLVDCVLAAVPPKLRDKRLHPATRTFQAVRIAVNRELEDLSVAIEAAARCLAPAGRMAVLSYHSGEDRAVKHVFHRLAKEGFDELTRKPLVPSAAEIAANPKSRSAKLRALRRQENPKRP